VAIVVSSTGFAELRETCLGFSNQPVGRRGRFSRHPIHLGHQQTLRRNSTTGIGCLTTSVVPVFGHSRTPIGFRVVNGIPRLSPGRHPTLSDIRGYPNRLVLRVPGGTTEAARSPRPIGPHHAARSRNTMPGRGCSPVFAKIRLSASPEPTRQGRTADRIRCVAPARYEPRGDNVGRC